MRLRLRLKYPAVLTLNTLTAPSINGDAVVGQTLYFVNGTYSATPDSITPSVTVGGSAVDMSGTDSLLLLDMFAGPVVGYSEIAHKAGYTDSAPNAATSTGAVANIDLTNAITAFTRTSTSGTVPMTWSVTLAANVYEGYYLRAQVFSDSGLTTQTQDIRHLLTHADLQSGATIDLTSDGLTTIGATSWLELSVFTTSPNGYGYSFTFPTAISPTDAAVAMTWSPTDKTAGVTLSTDHLTMTNTTGSGAIRASRGIGTGKKVYWELTGVTCFNPAAADASAVLGTGWGSTLDGQTPTTDAGTWFNANGGVFVYSSTIRNTIGTFTNTDVIGFTLDTTGASPILGAVKNGTPLGTITMASITLPIFPAVQGSSGNVATLNPGITPGGTDGVAHPQAGFVNP